MDVVGWSFILHEWLRALAEKLEKLEQLHVDPPTTATNGHGRAPSGAEATRRTASL